ncbi:MAG: hypothetical protein ABSE71_04070 [Candidatus Micrarchaeaceae archaeon]
MFSIRGRITEEINTVISPSETIELVLRQSLLHSIAPDAIVVTDRRVVLIHHSFWGLYMNFNLIKQTEMNIVPFKNIMSVAMINGKVLASVNLRVLGFVDATRSTKLEWDIPGLRAYDALAATNTLGRVVEGRSEAQDARIAPDTRIEYNETPETHVPYVEKNNALKRG